MASSIASHVNLGDSSLEGLEIHLPKPTAIDKIGGIFCHMCNVIFPNKKDFDSHYAQHKNESTEIVYTCVVCKKQINSYPSFRGHCYLNHVVKNKFQCTHCSRTFSKLLILNNHITSVHDYKCISCDERFTSKKTLETHKRLIHVKAKNGIKDEPPYDCFSCGTVLKNVDACESHIDDHCEIHYPCPICKDILQNKLEATKHLMTHFDEKFPTDISLKPSIGEDRSIDVLGGIVCCHCDLLFRNRAEIDDHFMIEHEDKPNVYTCNICGKQFENYTMFGNHCYSHIAKNRFQCDQCDKTFPRLSLLVIHTEAFHTSCAAEKPFSCDFCGHGFKTRARLQLHMRIVHEESSIRCMKPGCSSTFERPKDLIHHLNNAHNLENWCWQCGLQFASLSSAQKHLDVHCRKQYSCPVCRRQYREKYHMINHIAVHFESVLHICKMCGKGYSARNRLMHHLKTHSDIRSFQCSYCRKGFLKPHELEQHLNVHTGTKPYSCTLCPRKFASSPNWAKHLSKIHNLDKATIKQLRKAQEAKKALEKHKSIKTSPMKAESGIESAGSEVSDFYTFVESDDSNNDLKNPQTDLQTDWENTHVGNQTNNMINTNEIDIQDVTHTICDPISGELMSITDTVNAAIDRIDSLDEDLDMMAAKDMNEFNTGESEFNTGNIIHDRDDSSDIQAIVEHIDAMSGEMEADNQMNSNTNNISVIGDDETGVLEYANMMPVDNSIFNTSNAQHTSLPEMSYYQPTACQPEYGPDFTDQGTGLANDGFINLDEFIMPHINPLLTINADNNKKYVQNMNFNFDNVTVPSYETQDSWQPSIITKVYPYEENNDANILYRC